MTRDDAWIARIDRLNARSDWTDASDTRDFDGWPGWVYNTL